jgi:hypothetical protein
MSVVFDEAGKAAFKRHEIWMRAMYFFTGLLIISWAIWLLALSHLISRPLLIAIAVAFMLVAFFIALKKKGRLFFKDVFQTLKITPEQKRSAAWLQYLGIAALFIFFVISLAPPTDADSLDYHLGIPVEMLRTGSLWFDIHNIHFRLAGFGEMINLLGVANGCVQLGAFLQMLALFWLLSVYVQTVPPALKKHVYSLVLGIPILLFLIPGQKHQLTGIAATSLCFYILCFHTGQLTKRVVVLWVCTLLLAVGIKYSFILSATALLLYALLQTNNKSRIIITTALLGSVFLAPVFIYKYLHFGDALSPLFERFSSVPDPAVIGLGRFLRNFRDPGFGFPIGLFLPAGMGTISVILGWCAVLLLLAFSLYKKYWRECITVFLFVALTIALGQRTARFFMEPYLWMLLPLLLHWGYKKAGKVVFTIADIQFVLLFPFILFSFYLLAPGIVSNKLREKVLVRTSFGYTESKWMDEVLPADARIATHLRSRAYLPRPYFPREYMYYALKDSRRVKMMDSMMQAYGITYLVLQTDKASDRLKDRYNAALFAGPKKFTIATRNPFNSGTYELVIYKLK